MYLLQLQALLEYEKYLRKNGDLHLPGSTDSLSSSLDKEVRIFPQLLDTIESVERWVDMESWDEDIS